MSGSVLTFFVWLSYYARSPGMPPLFIFVLALFRHTNKPGNRLNMKPVPCCFLLFLVLLAFATCKEKQPAPHPQQAARDSITPATDTTAHLLSTDSTWAHNYRIIADSIMPVYKDLVKYYFRKYRQDSCKAILLDSADFAHSEGVRPFGHVHFNKPPISVFLWPQLSWCDLQGDAWYFTDTSLPRLETESGLCYPSTLFPVSDIDEDGTAEIGQLYTSCSSHYQSLHVYSLKNNAWKEMGRSVFDLNYMTPAKDSRQYVRKTGKGRFEMLEITDRIPRQKTGEKTWLKYSF